MLRILLFPLLSIVTPFIWIGHKLTGGNRGAEARAVRRVQKRIIELTELWAQVCGTTHPNRLRARIDMLDAQLQRPFRTPLGIITADDYSRLILLRMERNYYVRWLELQNDLNREPDR